MKKPRLKFYCILSLFLSILAMLYIVLSLTLLNEDWLKDKIKQYIRDKYGTNTNIESLEFYPWKGHSVLSNITLNKTEKNRKVIASVASIELDLQILPLIFRNIVVEKFVMSQPDIRIDVHRKTETTPEETLHRLSKVGFTVAHEVIIRPLTEMFLEVLDVFTGNSHTTITINDLAIHDGKISYFITRDEAEPLNININNFEYSAKHVNAKIPIDFVDNADITALVLFEETNATFSQHFSSKPNVLEFTKIDLGNLDKYLKQRDALKVEKGIGNIKFYFGSDTVLAQINLDNLQIAKNVNTVHKDFAFIPIDKFINHINQNNGKLNLDFELEKTTIQTSQDLQFVAIEAWEGMWKQVLKKISSDKLIQFKEKGTQKLMNFFNNRKPTKENIE